MAKNDEQVNFRMPAELRAKLRACAEDNNRTLTAEIVHRLERSLASTDSAPEAALPAATSSAEKLDLILRRLEEQSESLKTFRMRLYYEHYHRLLPEYVKAGMSQRDASDRAHMEATRFSEAADVGPPD